MGNKNSIMDFSHRTIKSLSDAYLFLQVIKKFIKILLITSENKEKESIYDLVNLYMPKYLFKKKSSFQIAVEKANHERIVNINKLLQKTERYLRFNDENYLIIIQRFMFNFAKVMK